MGTQHEVPSVSPSEHSPFDPCGVTSGGTVPNVPNVQVDQQSEGTTAEIDDPKVTLKNLKSKHKDRPIIAQLNINFLYPKLDPLIDIVKENVDILMVSETKLDETFTTAQFQIEGSQEPIRIDRNKNGGGIMIYIRDGLAAKEIKSHRLRTVEGTFIKLVIRNSKWLIMAGYNPDKKKIGNFLNEIGKEVDKQLAQYENLIFLGDFNSEVRKK